MSLPESTAPSHRTLSTSPPSSSSSPTSTSPASSSSSPTGRYAVGLRDVMRAHLEALAGEASAGDGLPSLAPLAAMLRSLRRSPARRREHVLAALVEELEGESPRMDGVRTYVQRVVASAYLPGALAEYGVLPEHGLFAEIRARIVEQVLPSERAPHDLREILGELFDPRDVAWVRAIDAAQFERIVHALAPHAPTRPLEHGALRALELVAHRIASTGEDPELGRFASDGGSHESPFVALASEIAFEARRYREPLERHEDARFDAAQVRVLLAQCREATTRIRRRAPRTGVTFRMTYQLERLDDLLRRASQLVASLDDDERASSARAELVRELVVEQGLRERVVPLITRAWQLVAVEVASRSARTGEHYIARTPREWLGMWGAAGGAGLVVACMAILKVAIANLHAPPLIEALLFSANYAGGFVLVGALGMTIATKQPSMTAAALASSIDDARPRETRRLVETVQALTRSQLAAILGNCLVAGPTAWALAALASHLLGAPVASVEKAHHLALDVDPLASPAIAHAMLTGCYLSISGLVAGYVATSLSARHIPARLRRSERLRRWLGAARTERVATMIGASGGTVAGSVVLGVLLGSTGTLGALLGIPVDIRHVSFASANAGLALATLGPSGVDLGRLVAGLVGIGLANLCVSFAISLSFALASRRGAVTPALGRDLVRAAIVELPAWLVPVGPSAARSDASGHDAR